ncbi:hypothetical protein RC54_03860 [Herbaspirillum rubrisubalbicans]|uniref:Uncharacterized protein n=1 Tax=Herbaspirillum rubrisubalbicans TaxID=80842 RepID=A0AAD0U8D5_9BURK|nr:hypothetical protein RC54_03860 [Herbaspirillum rubrisubalbicans]
MLFSANAGGPLSCLFPDTPLPLHFLSDIGFSTLHLLGRSLRKIFLARQPRGPAIQDLVHIG